MGGVVDRLELEIVPERRALPVIRQVVTSGENLGDEGKNYEGEHRHFVLGIGSRCRTVVQKGGTEGEWFEMTSPVRVLLAARDLRDVRYPYGPPGTVPI